MMTVVECIEEFERLIDESENKRHVKKRYQIKGGEEKTYVSKKKYRDGIIRKRRLLEGLEKLKQKVMV